MGVRISNGQMVMRTATDILVGGSNPRAANTAAVPPPASAGIRTADRKICGRVRYHWTKGGCDTTWSPVAWSLLSKNF